MQFILVLMCALFAMPSLARADQLLDARVAYDNGDAQTALKLFRALADRGNAIAQRQLGMMYEFGVGLKKDAAKAKKWYRRAAENGDSFAQYKIGEIYTDMYAQNRSPDKAEAYFWYCLSAAAGNKISKAARDYEANRLTPEQKAPVDKRVEKWQKIHPSPARTNYDEVTEERALAERGSVRAQWELGLMYADGRGVKKDDTEAMKWFLKAADRSSSAKFLLGMMYENGEGVTQNYEEAYFWYSLAARSANRPPPSSIKLTPKQKAAVEERVKEYKLVPSPPQEPQVCDEWSQHSRDCLPGERLKHHID
jgi:TPR repeat protein